MKTLTVKMPATRYNSKGWVLGECACGRRHYVEPHGTTAPCECSDGGWTEHQPIPYSKGDLVVRA